MADDIEDFNQFWNAFPRKVAKGDARKAWKQVEKIRPPLQALLTAVDAGKQSKQWRSGEGAYIPYPATWLRQERWEDSYEVEVKALPKVLTEADRRRAWHEKMFGKKDDPIEGEFSVN